MSKAHLALCEERKECAMQLQVAESHLAESRKQVFEMPVFKP